MKLYQINQVIELAKKNKEHGIEDNSVKRMLEIYNVNLSDQQLKDFLNDSRLNG